MSTPPPEPPATEPPAAPEGGWIVPPDGPPVASPEHGRRSRYRTGLIAAGLVAAGLVVGGGIGYAVSSDDESGSHHSAVAAPEGTAGAGMPGGPGHRAGDGDGPGGVAGEEHVQGTITAIGSASVTVKSAGGTTTYAVTGSTEIVRNGAVATLTQLEVGDPVVVHVLPGTGTTKQVERILAGSLPPGGRDRDGG